MSTTDGKHIMFSYAWKGGHRKVDEIARQFRSAGIPIWMDTRNGLGDDLIDGMAEAVEDSIALCYFVTPEYQESKYCEMELKYAKDLNKPIIPCFLTDFRPRKWLGIITAGLIRYNFFDDANENVLNSLIRYIQRDILKVRVQLPAKSNSTKQSAAASSIENMNRCKTGAGYDDSDEEESPSSDYSPVYFSSHVLPNNANEIPSAYNVQSSMRNMTVNERSRRPKTVIRGTSLQRTGNTGSQTYKKYL